MKYKPGVFDNSEKAIENLKKEHQEAKEFVFDWMIHEGYNDNEYVKDGLDFDDIFHVLSEYKRQNKL